MPYESKYGALANGLTQGFAMGMNLRQLKQQKIEFEHKKQQDSIQNSLNQHQALLNELNTDIGRLNAMGYDKLPASLKAKYANELNGKFNAYTGSNYPVNLTEADVDEQFTQAFKGLTSQLAVISKMGNEGKMTPSEASFRFGELILANAGNIKPSESIELERLVKLSREVSQPQGMKELSAEKQFALDFIRKNIPEDKQTHAITSLFNIGNQTTQVKSEFDPTGLFERDVAYVTDSATGAIERMGPVGTWKDTDSLRNLKIKGVSREEASTLSFSEEFLSHMDLVNQLMFENGQFRQGIALALGRGPAAKKAMLATGQITQKDIDDAGRLEGSMLAGREALLRPGTGAAFGTEELMTIESFLYPQRLAVFLLEGPNTFKQRLNSASRAISGTVSALDPQGIKRSIVKDAITQAPQLTITTPTLKLTKPWDQMTDQEKLDALKQNQTQGK